MRYIKNLTVILLVALSLPVFSQQGFQWAVEAGGNNLDGGRRIAVDSDGNYYVIGYFEGCVTFGGNTTVTSNSNTRDLFVASYTCNGDLRWVNTIGSSANDLHNYGTLGIDVDGDNDVYATGSFAGTATFTSTSGGSVNRVSSGSTDIFVIKYDNNGQRLWDVEYGSTGEDFGSDIRYRATNDDIVITGGFNGTVNFGGNSRTSAGSLDAYLLHMDAGGTLIQVRAMGSNGQDVGLDIEVTANDAVFVSGNYGYGSSGVMTFQTSAVGTTTIASTSSTWDAFIAFFNPSTDYFSWARGINTANNENGDAMTATNTRAYLVGNFNVSTTIGATNHTSAGGYDVFVAEYDHSGTLQNSQRYGGTSDDIVYAAGFNTDLFAAGLYSGTTNFSGNMETSAGSNDIFVAHIDETTLTANDVFSLGGTGSDAAGGIVLPNACEFQVTGNFSSSYAVGASLIASQGSNDMLIAGYNLCDLAVTLSDTCIADTPTLSVGAARAGFTGQWYRDGIIIDGATGTSLAITRSGRYRFCWQNCQTTDCIDTFISVKRCCPAGMGMTPDKSNGVDYREHSFETAKNSTVNAADAPVLTLRPNPVNAVLQVEVNSTAPLSNAHLEISGSDGKVVATVTVSGEVVQYINVQHLAQGVYYLSLVADGAIQTTEKFVIARE